MPILKRLSETGRAPVHFEIDGEPATGLSGDTVLTAVLTQRERLRISEFSQQPRAGFCLIGACQDCWMRTAEGAPLRACTTMLAPGMRLVTGRLVRGDSGWGVPLAAGSTAEPGAVRAVSPDMP